MTARQTITRRQAIGAGAAALAGGWGPARRSGPAPSDEFVASVGLCVHLASAAYARMFNEVLRRVRELGVRHLRDDMRPSDDLRRWRRLHDEAGARAHLLASPSTNTIDEMLTYVRALGLATVSAIEGQNEGDGDWFRAQPSARPDWAQAVVAYQRDLFEAVRASFPGGSLPVVSPTVLDFRPRDMLAIAGAAPYCDIVALHAYVQEQQPPETPDLYAGLNWYLREMRDPFKPDAPVMITEAGYRTGPTGVSPRAAAVYLPRLLLHAFDRGIVRSFVYEMLDEGRDPRDPEQNYGLIRADGTPKPAYGALQVLLNALSDPGPAFHPEPFRLEVRGAPADMRCCCFAKRNGERWLALWRSSAVWDRSSRRDLPLQPVRTALVLEKAPRAAMARAVWPDASWQELPPSGTLSVMVSEIVSLVRIVP